MKNTVLIISLLLLAGCTTMPEKQNTSLPKPSRADEETTSSVDYQALQNHLDMDRDKESLGYKEKAFNTCEVGYGFSPSKDCHKEQFVVINFRLLCRESEGTISTILTDEDLRPLERRNVRWNLKGIQGVTYTDNDGYAQIVTSSRLSQNGQRLRLAIGNEFLYMRSNEIKKVITPHSWCDEY
ncbi:hypothetical protein ACES2L_05600 [Bdellovibrio bacteriovorus]